jgi:ribosomal protein S27E
MSERIIVVAVERVTELEVACPGCGNTVIVYPMNPPADGSFAFVCPNCGTADFWIPDRAAKFQRALGNYKKFVDTLKDLGLTARFRYKADNS